MEVYIVKSFSPENGWVNLKAFDNNDAAVCILLIPLKNKYLMILRMNLLKLKYLMLGVGINAWFYYNAC